MAGDTGTRAGGPGAEVAGMSVAVLLEPEQHREALPSRRDGSSPAPCLLQSSTNESLPGRG